MESDIFKLTHASKNADTTTTSHSTIAFCDYYTLLTSLLWPYCSLFSLLWPFLPTAAFSLALPLVYMTLSQ